MEDSRFDPHLAQAENLSALFVALNDEVFEIRELAMCTIGRLSSMNPAYVMPSLRKVLIQVGMRDDIFILINTYIFLIIVRNLSFNLSKMVQKIYPCSQCSTE